jgi:cytochrome c2
MEIDGFDERWNRDLLVASLRDQSLHRLRIVDGSVRFAERIPVGERIRYVHRHADGRIVLWTDAKQVLFLTPAGRSRTAELIDDRLDALDVPESRRRELSRGIALCQECHALDSPVSERAPSLVGIYGRHIASSTYPGYTEALRAQNGLWDASRLKRYLTDPDGAIPGTSMPDPGLSDSAVEDLVGLLQTLSAPE